METNILKISNATNSLTEKYQIGNLLNKNYLIRNLALMRNIGKYSLYDAPLYPEVGMAVNFYEHRFNKPTDIGSINGLIGYNNGITDNGELVGKTSGFRSVSVEVDEGEVTKDVYVVNNSEPTRSLEDVMSRVNKSLRQENRYLSSQDFSSNGMSVDVPFIGIDTNREDTFSITRDTNTTYAYNEGDVEGDNVYNDDVIFEISKTSDYKATSKGDLLSKTNKLFNEGKINSIVGRFYAAETDYTKIGENGEFGKKYLSRGRNLLKAGKSPSGKGYDNPYCRVWTVNNQYSKMTDLIRPFSDDGTFRTIEKTQDGLGEGFRPANGNKRLNDMSVLKSNGRVNFTPHKTEDGSLDKESIKRCMFSIENLAWKDVEISERIKRMIGTSGSSIMSVGQTLSEEQRGPNGGRIMWFPPYNLKFSEDANANWNGNAFIGRGEKIYTYVDSERNGSLSFTLLIDHPSILDKWKIANPNKNDYGDELDVLRYFAGCGDLDEESLQEEDEGKNNENKNNLDALKNVKIEPTYETIRIPVFFPNYYTGADDLDEFEGYMYRGAGCVNGIAYESSTSGSTLNEPITGKNGTWGYRVDKKYYDIKLVKDVNYNDKSGFTLNSMSVNSSTASAETALAKVVGQKLVSAAMIDSDDVYGDTYFSFYDLYKALNVLYSTGSTYATTAATKLQNILKLRGKEIIRIGVKGFASSHGHKDDNEDYLAPHRAQTLIDLIKRYNWFCESKGELYAVEDTQEVGLPNGNMDVSSIDAKIARSAVVTIYLKQDVTTEKAKNAYREIIDEKTRKKSRSKVVLSAITYDDEYHYFSELKETDDIEKKRIIDKVKYFDPAYHSITPEGFNARLTFLNQCVRQGPTVASSDINSNAKNTGVGNLAFGRAPYCVLRIGDFYNTKILIENITINYESGGGLQWDLNPEGAGVQPMCADVQIRFKFIGGSDISGPIERLQNAVSFNYYSNASIYDRRADFRKGFIDSTTDGEVYHWDAILENKGENE